MLFFESVDGKASFNLHYLATQADMHPSMLHEELTCFHFEILWCMGSTDQCPGRNYFHLLLRKSMNRVEKNFFCRVRELCAKGESKGASFPDSDEFNEQIESASVFSMRR
jgi:hypothetical protein